MKRKETTKTIETLIQFMHGKVTPRVSTVEDWNAAREDAKAIFSHTLICQLDASGIISSFSLKRI